MRAELEGELAQLEKQLEAITAEGITVKNDIAAFDQRISELKSLRETFSNEQKAFGVLTARIEQSEADINTLEEKRSSAPEGTGKSFSERVFFCG